MICFLHPENLVLTAPAEDNAKTHAQHTNGLILDALFKKFGELPPLDEIAKHVLCVYDEQHTAHYVWLDNTNIEVGAQIDMSNVLVSIAPNEPEN